MYIYMYIYITYVYNIVIVQFSITLMECPKMYRIGMSEVSWLLVEKRRRHTFKAFIWWLLQQHFIFTIFILTFFFCSGMLMVVILNLIIRLYGYVFVFIIYSRIYKGYQREATVLSKHIPHVLFYVICYNKIR